jgi:DUF1680 family protein
VALTRGPLVYCAEETDLGFAPHTFAVDTESETVSSEALGVTVLTVEGIRTSPKFDGELYAPDGTTNVEDASAKLIPYYAWNNRGPNAMQVWLRKL